jgi:hypothetical protein
MRTTGIFKTRLIKLKNWPMGKTLHLIPFGDIHHDSPAFSPSAFKKFTDYASKQKDALFLNMGDSLDSFSTTERIVLYDSKLHESTRKREEKECKGRIQSLADELEFMRGKLIGIMGGNHYPIFADGTNGDEVLAERLGTVFLGACCAIRIVFSRAGSASTVSCDVFAHHGRGGGTTAGGRYNAVEKLSQICEADIFLMGDNHARGCFPIGDRLYLTNGGRNRMPMVKSKTRWVGRTGSFLRAYVENDASYVVDGAMPPANLGWIEFTLTPRREETEQHDIMEIEIGAIQ